MTPPLRFIVVTISLLVLWLLIDVAYVQLEYPSTLRRAIDVGLYPAAFLSFFWAGWPLFADRAPLAKHLYRALTALAACAVWLILASIVVLQAHVAMGGRL
ncbi:hypothetical protein ACTSKR_12030 [Chitinibacteraceae bacterium HSL-7]